MTGSSLKMALMAAALLTVSSGCASLAPWREEPPHRKVFPDRFFVQQSLSIESDQAGGPRATFIAQLKKEAASHYRLVIVDPLLGAHLLSLTDIDGKVAVQGSLREQELQKMKDLWTPIKRLYEEAAVAAGNHELNNMEFTAGRGVVHKLEDFKATPCSFPHKIVMSLASFGRVTIQTEELECSAK
jgi:hypothetical protein